MTRWNLSPQERQNLREVLGKLLIPQYDPNRPLGEQLLERLGGSGSTFQGPLMRFLAGQTQKPEKPVEEEWEKMPSDYAGGPEEWARLTESEKRYVHESLKVGRKVYISVPQKKV